MLASPCFLFMPPKNKILSASGYGTLLCLKHRPPAPPLRLFLDLFRVIVVGGGGGLETVQRSAEIPKTNQSQTFA